MAELVGTIYYDVTADTSKLVGQSRAVDRQTQSMAASFNKITQAIKLYAIAMSLVKSAQMADDMRLLSARVQVAAGSIERGAAAMGELQKISARTQIELAANVSVFNRLNQSILQMGGTQRDTLRVTELLAKAIKVSGASGAEASSAMTQFGQALGSGKLAGDELRSLLENAPYLMQQLAAGMGVPIGALKALGEQGKLTADVVTNALAKAAEKIEADFQKLPQTLSGAMAMASDAAKRANEALDNLTGSSAALTGATRGLGETLDMLAQQFAAATTEADKLGRSKEVGAWSRATTTALSYVADAADMVWQTMSVLGRNVGFVFESVGAEIGGIGAQIAAVVRGDFAQAGTIGDAMKADAAKRRKDLDAADADTLRGRLLAGQRMRQQLAALDSGTDGSDTLDRKSRGGAPSSLRPPAGSTGGGTKFDAQAYIAGLRKSATEGIEQINIVEQEALRKNQAMLEEGKISRKTAAEAATLIELNAANDRRDIQLAAGEERRAFIEQQGQDEIDARRRLERDQMRGIEFAQDTSAADDPVLALELELQRRSDLLTQYALIDMGNAEVYAQAKVDLERQTQDRIAEILARRTADTQAANSALLQGYGAFFGSMAEMTKEAAGEQSSAYRAMFAVSKAFAIADSIIKIQQGISAALSLPYPANIVAAASTAAAAAGLVSTIQGVTFGGGRQFGGPVSRGTMYRVNEGGAPEMFTAANGAQFAMPTADGRVTPGGGQSGGVVVELRVINQAPGVSVTQRAGQDGRPELVIAEIAGQISERRGPVWGALRGSTNVQAKL